MKAIYSRRFFTETGSTKPLSNSKTVSVNLPFNGVTARAIIVRRRDGAIIGTLHQNGTKYALPGGGLEDGESPDQTILRELKEEQITLIGADENWRERLTVDYFRGYRELAIWYLFLVDDASMGECDENIETRWISQNEDVWYPLIRDRIVLELLKQIPHLVKTRNDA
jgi:8-oxo-dGTP pyrophosphatase MutT (NUDIX family)